MCCGKGGDLLKWTNKSVRHLIFADIADVSVQQCRNRYNDLVKKNQRMRNYESTFSAEFIVADCTKVNLKNKYVQFVAEFQWHESNSILAKQEKMIFLHRCVSGSAARKI